MIIPIRCFTCGKVLADKWNQYKKMCEDEKPVKTSTTDKDLHPSFQGNKGDIMNKLEITKICCRRHFLGHVDLIEII
jgi:DNA-directed RNA polymerase I, II, and III subunit RPABC5